MTREKHDFAFEYLVSVWMRVLKNSSLLCLHLSMRNEPLCISPFFPPQLFQHVQYNFENNIFSYFPRSEVDRTPTARWALITSSAHKTLRRHNFWERIVLCVLEMFILYMHIVFQIYCNGFRCIHCRLYAVHSGGMCLCNSVPICLSVIIITAFTCKRLRLTGYSRHV